MEDCRDGYRTFDVEFFVIPGCDPDDKYWDETEFDIEEADFETMFNELTELFNIFCEENAIHGSIFGIREVVPAARLTA